MPNRLPAGRQEMAGRPGNTMARAPDFKWTVPLVSVSSTEASAAFPIPTVSVSPSEAVVPGADQNTPTLSQVWYAPASATDFDLHWVQFVMQQYYSSHHPDLEAPKIQTFSIDMAGSPEDEHVPSKG